jgi:hypothetical protein
MYLAKFQIRKASNNGAGNEKNKRMRKISCEYRGIYAYNAASHV